ncbi:hypothetical protein SDRG_00467 [Saprolegnia diclina VS20]|uniref:Uncharacterized protein n=1 Tax=Saprolegnia diclina (strain VS20) TaxID=1156394 RepID=T0QWX8_SAPDV|nr:hypothetical protein SDRG_00467 [Saprolegnia diclina VS20]EQC42744.1 hypothetical protein SDRG_00467 [Saprolegnia diclina VS20]|eukprot:XP_008604167.1 hypothetical protein SDRG_00467 [Saprolegnia diclina VS20]
MKKRVAFGIVEEFTFAVAHACCGVPSDGGGIGLHGRHLAYQSYDVPRQSARRPLRRLSHMERVQCVRLDMIDGVWTSRRPYFDELMQLYELEMRELAECTRIRRQRAETNAVDVDYCCQPKVPGTEHVPMWFVHIDAIVDSPYRKSLQELLSLPLKKRMSRDAVPCTPAKARRAALVLERRHAR